MFHVHDGVSHVHDGCSGLCCADGVAPRRSTSHLARRANTAAILACVLADGGIGEVIRTTSLARPRLPALSATGARRQRHARPRAGARSRLRHRNTAPTHDRRRLRPQLHRQHAVGTSSPTRDYAADFGLRCCHRSRRLPLITGLCLAHVQRCGSAARYHSDEPETPHSRSVRGPDR